MSQPDYHCQSCGASIVYSPYIRNKYGKSYPLEPESKRRHYCIKVSEHESDMEMIAHARLVLDAINESLIRYQIVWTAEGVPLIKAR